MAVSIALKIKICRQMFHIGSMNLCPKYGYCISTYMCMYNHMQVWRMSHRYNTRGDVVHSLQILYVQMVIHLQNLFYSVISTSLQLMYHIN